ncbi:hypothetical protein LWI29_008692 [Acer saccharum]|uniref:Uncharacterized protein n=1 Tax=Acer saccharum TaxID=4024 RepID=A0AA39SUF8_ACESA|nr:hypothetical protein LWI29_008692 [Acer saccharum]
MPEACVEAVGNSGSENEIRLTYLCCRCWFESQLTWRYCYCQINVEMGGKCFVVKIEEEQFSIEKQEELLGIIPVGRVGTLIPVEGGSVVENSEDVRRLSVDGDKATHEDSYERVGVSAGVKRSGSLGGNYAATDKFFEGVSGQERGKGPSKEKARDEVVIVGPMTDISSVVMGCAPVGVKEVSSGTPGLFQVEGSVPGSSSKSIRGRLKKHSMTLRSKQNSELRNLEDDVAKVLEKGLALGLNFNGRKEELLDIIAKRDVMNDNRFRDLVRRLAATIIVSAEPEKIPQRLGVTGLALLYANIIN